jgi:hypothetical protein
MGHKVLLVTTSQSRLGDDITTAGSWLEELAAPYYTLLDAGCTVEIASVRGGNAPIDAASVVDPWLTDHGRRLLDDTRTMKRLLDTPSLAQVRAADHDAVSAIAKTRWPATISWCRSCPKRRCVRPARRCRLRPNRSVAKPCAIAISSPARTRRRRRAARR